MRPEQLAAQVQRAGVARLAFDSLEHPFAQLATRPGDPHAPAPPGRRGLRIRGLHQRGQLQPPGQPVLRTVRQLQLRRAGGEADAPAFGIEVDGLAVAAAQLRDPMILLLCGAFVVVLLLGDGSDAVIIALVVVLNSTIGVVQEVRAENAVAALDRMAAPRARVRRDGDLTEIAASELVAGDIVRLEAGYVVPADLVLDEAVDLELDEAAMTGESIAVPRSVGEEALSGTTVTRGRGFGVVVRTGAEESCSFGDGVYGSETSMAPRVGSTSEDDGYLVTLTTDMNDDASYCLVFDAAAVGDGPVCKLRLPERISSGTHSTWAAGEELRRWRAADDPAQAIGL